MAEARVCRAPATDASATADAYATPIDDRGRRHRAALGASADLAGRGGAIGAGDRGGGDARAVVGRPGAAGRARRRVRVCAGRGGRRSRITSGVRAVAADRVRRSVRIHADRGGRRCRIASDIRADAAFRGRRSGDLRLAGDRDIGGGGAACSVGRALAAIGAEGRQGAADDIALVLGGVLQVVEVERGGTAAGAAAGSAKAVAALAALRGLAEAESSVLGRAGHRIVQHRVGAGAAARAARAAAAASAGDVGPHRRI